MKLYIAFLKISSFHYELGILELYFASEWTMYVKKATKDVENHNIYSKVKKYILSPSTFTT
jgi:hypothetical protein